MTQNEIQDLVQKEMATFLNKPFVGILPKWFLENFGRAVMEMPQLDVPYRGETIQSILGKTNDELTFFEVGLATNIWLSVPPKFVDSKIEKYVVKKIALEGIRVQWNLMNNTEMERLKRKAASFAANSNNNGRKTIIN